MNEKYMDLAIKEAYKAYNKEDVPVGAVIISRDHVISKAHNTKNITNNATNHAEILAISKACKKLGTWRLNDCTMYVTLEPCPMCYGAIIESRIKKVVYIADSDYDKLHVYNSKNLKMEKITNSKYIEDLTNFFKNLRS